MPLFGRRIGSATEDTVSDGTEKFPVSGTKYMLVSTVAEYIRTLTQTLTNKTLTSPVITTPQINDTSADHQYVFAVSELSADRTVTLPLLIAADVFVFADFIQTLTNKTLTTPTIASMTNAQHNHSNAAGGGTLATTIINSGVYTPTRSAEANLDANVTMTEAQYLRVGATVTVSGRFTADPTTTLTATSFEITLPVASNIGAVEDLAGVAVSGAIAGQSAAILGVVANDTAKFLWNAVDVTSQSWSYTFTYQVI